MPITESLPDPGTPLSEEADTEAALGSAPGRRIRHPWAAGLGLLLAFGIVAGVTAVVMHGGESGPVAVESGGAEASTDLDDLLGVDWYFISMSFDDGRPALDLSTEVTELRFHEDGTYSSHVCNYQDGEYQPTGTGSIAMELHSSTAMRCGGTIGDAEHEMFLKLRDQVTWEVRGDTLTLRSPGFTASLQATLPVFPERLTVLESADHPAAVQYAIGYSGVPEGTQTLEILFRSDPSQEFTSATVESDRVLSPTGLTPLDGRTIVASWLPPNTAKAWVRLSTGGAEINLNLKKLSDNRIAGWTSLPEPSGVLVAFDADGNEIARSTPFDF